MIAANVSTMCAIIIVIRVVTKTVIIDFARIAKKIKRLHLDVDARDGSVQNIDSKNFRFSMQLTLE